jgi:hypothetical protein
MKKLIILVCILIAGTTTKAQQSFDTKSYRILKVDAINLMGLAVQKGHVSFEWSPFSANHNNVPTLQADAYIPFGSLSEKINVNIGFEAGLQLRFYHIGTARRKTAEGWYAGVGMDGGWTRFSRDYSYFLDGGIGVTRTYTHTYNRARTGVYGLIGVQTRLTDKVYFDANIGMGWSNVNAVEEAIDIDPNYIRQSFWNSSTPFYSLFDEGKYQRFYMPVSFGIGYNFGTK